MSQESSYLVADIGGTNARFAIARGSVACGFDLDQVRRLKNEDFEHLRDAAMAYLQSCEGACPTRACFAVASPIRAGRVQLTNATWSFRPDELGGELGMETLIAVNDFEAQARGAPLTPAADIAEIAAGRPIKNTPIAVLGPGTGLGLGLLIPDGDTLKVVATEGGHAGFAPRTDLEIEVGRILAREYGFVSWERILSGRGLVNIHRALCQIEGKAWTGDRPEEITRDALAEPGSMGARVVDFFYAALGGYAGDVAVLAGARAGIYLGGGILPRIQTLLETSPFRSRFLGRGPMSGYVSDIPIHLIQSDGAALRGAAALAEQGASTS
ncbi:glucokinase [Maricaulis maris]|jgi:glucokinase|uniref:glucokinase n=1 Tax=Maricaulis maris TaxID=74318 RepID=UPI00292222CE|nr:glucokinase [Maricaulis maris]